MHERPLPRRDGGITRSDARPGRIRDDRVELCPNRPDDARPFEHAVQLLDNTLSSARVLSTRFNTAATRAGVVIL